MGVGSFRKRMIKILEILKSQWQKSITMAMAMAKINYNGNVKRQKSMEKHQTFPLFSIRSLMRCTTLSRVIARNEAISPAVKQQREDGWEGFLLRLTGFLVRRWVNGGDPETSSG